jgi:excisionase family DNA binding protein
MNEFLSTSEVAKILRLSRIAVFKKIKNGQLKATKVGRNYIVRRENLAEYLGESIGPEQRGEIDAAVKKATADYKETFKLLGKE